MPKFKTHANRMQHKIAKFIPSSMWHDNQLFCESLDETVLSLMKAKVGEVIPLLNKSLLKLNNQWLKKQAWLGIALTQPADLAVFREVATALKFTNNTLFSLLAILGNLNILKEFATKYADGVILEMIADNGFYTYTKAAENGHCDVLKYLELKAPKQILEMITAENFSPYKNAARNGHVDVLRHLETKDSTLVLEMIKAQNFYAYKTGASRGHFEVLKHLEAQAPSLVKNMVEADNFYAYRKANENGHFEISNWMLAKNNSCLAYAEMHMHEYGESSVKPFIEQQLAALHRDALNTPSHGVFNVDDAQARICFYMIRNLIRRNDRALNDEIRFLLNIPAVKAMAHTEVTPGQSNELVRLALTTGNREAASILLNIPEVSLLAAQNNFYRAEVSGQLDLAQLARDGESSMTALTKGEQKRLDAAIRRYGPTLKEKGVNMLIDALRAQLRERYEKNPAFIINEHKEKITLPMDFAELQRLTLSKEQYQQALEAYYRHKEHTAWRYIAKPNFWMNSKADYVCRDKVASVQWSTFEEYQPLIAMLWLAAGDETTPPTEGHTLKSRLDHFIEELALIGRSHNWDKTRINSKGKEEEYDDLAGDRPSCFSGVKRRLFQSVLGHPLITILTEDMILEEIRYFARNHFQLYINEETQKSLRLAFDDFLLNTTDLSAESKKLLQSLNIPNEKQHQFERYLSHKYGAQYTDDFSFHKLVCNKLSFSPDKADFFSNCHALMLDGITDLYQMVTGSDSKTLEFHSPSGHGFFKHPLNPERYRAANNALLPPKPET